MSRPSPPKKIHEVHTEKKFRSFTENYHYLWYQLIPTHVFLREASDGFKELGDNEIDGSEAIQRGGDHEEVFRKFHSRECGVQATVMASMHPQVDDGKT